jgi:hypothetical protein
MKLCVFFLGMVVFLSTSAASAGRKPAPRKPAPVHGPDAEIKRVAADIEKLHVQQQQELAKVQARYTAQIAALNLQRLYAEIARVRGEKKTAVYKKASPDKLQAIQAKYQPQIQALVKKKKAAEIQIASLTRQKQVELAKTRATYSKRIAKLDPPEGKLERLLEIAMVDASIAAYKLVDSAKAAEIRAKFQPQLKAMRGRIRARDVLLPSLDKQLNAQTAAIRAFYQARIAELDAAAERPELRMVRLLEARAFELANASDGKKRDQITADYIAKIAALQKLIDAKNERIALLTRQQNDQIAAVLAVYRGELAKIVPAETIREMELAVLWADENAALVGLIAAAELEVFRAKYLSRIDSLKSRTRAKQAEMIRLNLEMDRLLANVEADYLARFALLNPPDNLLEYQLLRLQERQWLEIVWLLEPVTVAVILDEYDRALAALHRQLHVNQGKVMPLAQRAMADMNRIVNDYNRRIAGLQAHLVRLLSR